MRACECGHALFPLRERIMVGCGMGASRGWWAGRAMRCSVSCFGRLGTERTNERVRLHQGRVRTGPSTPLFFPALVRAGWVRTKGIWVRGGDGRKNLPHFFGLFSLPASLVVVSPLRRHHPRCVTDRFAPLSMYLCGVQPVE